MYHELVTIIQALLKRGYDLRTIAGCVGTSKLALKYLLDGKPVYLEYRVKARLQFLYHHKRTPDQ